MNTPIVSDNQIKMWADPRFKILARSEEHTSELQSLTS
jgi:hypothetical protein